MSEKNINYVVTDPINFLCEEVLKKAGHSVKRIDTANMGKPVWYNPFADLKNEEDIRNHAHELVTSIKGDYEKRDENFWVNVERIICRFLMNAAEASKNEQQKNISTTLTEE